MADGWDLNMLTCTYNSANPNTPGGAVSVALAGFGTEQSLAVYLNNNGALGSPVLLGTVFSDGDGNATFSGHLPSSGLVADSNYLIEGQDQENGSADSSTFTIN